MRYLNLTIEEIDRLTLPEFKLAIKAYNLKQIDRMDELHLQAWLTVAAGATKKNGQPVYKKYIQFFDREAEEERLENKPRDKFNALSKHLKEKNNGSK